MSASQDKRAGREEKRRKEERADRRAMALYTAVGAVVVLAAIVLMIWTSGVLQRNLTAVEINGQKYTAADVQYYFDAAYTNALNTALSQTGTYPFDTTASTKEQIYDPESGQTWFDHLVAQAVEDLKTDAALASRATEEGYTLSDDAQQELDSYLTQLETVWISYGYNSRDAFIRASYGAYMTYDTLVSLVRQEVLANDYANTQVDAVTHGDSEYESYYQEHADDLDTITYTQFAFQARVATTDDEGNTVEMTEEEQAAALEELKTEQKALAEELRDKLEAGGDQEALAEEYRDQLYSSALDRQTAGAGLSGSSYAEWILDSGRSAGDVTVAEYDSGTAYYYYVVLFQDRQRDDTPTADVRHILIEPETDEGADEPTAAQLDAAEAQAQELLDQWKAGEATEDSFAELAVSNSADGGSAANGGLISNISTTSSYVEPFKSWALASGRQPGDTGLVQSDYGWHIMYFVSSGDPVWRQTVTNVLRDQDYEALDAQAAEGWTSTTGVGLKFIAE